MLEKVNKMELDGASISFSQMSGEFTESDTPWIERSYSWKDFILSEWVEEDSSEFSLYHVFDGVVSCNDLEDFKKFVEWSRGFASGEVEVEVRFAIWMGGDSYCETCGPSSNRLTVSIVNCDLASVELQVGCYGGKGKYDLGVGEVMAAADSLTGTKTLEDGALLSEWPSYLDSRDELVRFVKFFEARVTPVNK